MHRDLKPANVLLATDGPRVIDFGISRAADGTSLTAAGVVFGTPGYMSPEQAEGKAAGPDSDVFALGCVIAYAATGAGPFGSGTAAAVLYRVVHGEPALDGIPPRLKEIVSACLAKDPAARPPLRALSAAIASGMDATGPSAVSFWPRSVAGIISAYQARLEQETRPGGQPAEAEEFSWASAVHPRTTPSDPGKSKGPPLPPQAPPPNPGTRWPYASPGPQASPGAQASPGPRASPGAQASPGPRASPGAQASPGPRASPGAQGYPPPSGYGGAQASQPLPPPPRGYLPASGGLSANGGWPLGSGPMGYPQPYPPGSRGAIYALPSSMVTAVRLMYAGAAYALIYAIGVVMVANTIIRNYPYTRTSLGGVVFLTVLLSVIEIALWLGIARACKNRRNWARVTGTVLFGIHTLGALAVLGRSGLGLTKVLTGIGWLIACGAVIFLWQSPSSAFFRTPPSIGR